MKQPAKFSLAGLLVAIVAAVLYPNLNKDKVEPGASPPAAVSTAPNATPSATPTPAQTKPAPTTPASTPATAQPAAPTPPPAQPKATPTPAPAKSAAAPPASNPAKPSTTAKPAPKPATSSTVGFTSQRSFEEHFDKHGAEFGKITAEEYLSRAQTLRDAPLSANVLELVREDGVITRFDKKSGGFVAFHKDKTIRTFFHPNDGEAYFKRQAAR